KAKGEALVVFVNSPPGGVREVTLVRVDMKTMKAIGPLMAESNATPVDVSPSGNLLACMPDWTTRNGRDPEMIEIWQVNGKELKTVRRWNMGEHSEWDKRFEQLFFIGEGKLLTTSEWGGNVTLWDINKAQAIWQMKVTGHHTPALSANRKQFAALIDGGVGVFDAATGDTLARLTAEGAHGGVLAFSPDGERLACVTPRVLRVWELATGEMVHEVWFPKQMSAKSLDWINDGMVMVDRLFLVDMAKRIVLWQYELPTLRGEAIAQMAGDRYWVIGGGGHNAPYQLACLSVPDAAAKAKGETLTAESVLAVRPGAAVRVRINLPSASPEELQKVTKVLVDEIKANGMELAAEASIVIECSISDGGAETVTYSRFGFGQGGEQATVSKQLSVLSIKENGKELWVATGAYGAPFSVHQKEGQSIQDAVNAQKGSPVQFFLHAKLPKHVARHEADGTYGKSRLQP
ncbi:MAG: hypothetical protein WD872_07395, partial [Pirellulaceae bacterium]